MRRSLTDCFKRIILWGEATAWVPAVRRRVNEPVLNFIDRTGLVHEFPAPPVI